MLSSQCVLRFAHPEECLAIFEHEGARMIGQIDFEGGGDSLDGLWRLRCRDPGRHGAKLTHATSCLEFNVAVDRLLSEAASHCQDHPQLATLEYVHSSPATQEKACEVLPDTNTRPSRNCRSARLHDRALCSPSL